MKTKIYLTILLLLSLTVAHAQHVFINSYIEQTHVSPKIGTQFGFAFDMGYEVGAFYQQKARSLEFGESSLKPRIYEKEFFGAFFAGPILQRKKYNININARTGVSNKRNFVITPSIVANYKVTPNLHFQAGIGTRAFRPTFQVGVKFNTNI